MGTNIKSGPNKLRLDWASIILLFLGVAFLVESLKIWGKTTRIEPLGAGGWPIIMSVLWVACILVIMASDYFKRQPVPSYKIDIHDAATLRWILLVSLILIYIFIVRWAGFVMTTIVFLFAMMVGFGSTSKRHLIIAAITSVGATLIVYYCYTYAFQIPLPGQL
ncbi:MAG: tripartite tricarboxylate transporter TctB family protein [Syntrophales bacterium]